MGKRRVLSTKPVRVWVLSLHDSPSVYLSPLLACRLFVVLIVVFLCVGTVLPLLDLKLQPMLSYG